jgi:pimeloyl-ACP methyl ester carboxylesterase
VRGEFVDVGGTRLYYYASGSRGVGEPLLLVHGFPTSSHLWARVVPLLPAGYRVIVPDLLGYGRSDPASATGPAADVTVAGHARRMIRLLDVLGVERACVIGHGIGTAVAIDMWRAQPARVTRLGLVNPVDAPGRATGAPWIPRISIRFGGKLPAGMLLSGLRRRLARLYADPGAHAPAVDQYLRPFRGAQGRAALLRHLQALATDAEPAVAGALAAPDASPSVAATIVCGDQDPLVPPSSGERLRASMPESTLHRVTGGHFSPEESPEQVAEALRTLLRDDH